MNELRYLHRKHLYMNFPISVVQKETLIIRVAGLDIYLKLMKACAGEVLVKHEDIHTLRGPIQARDPLPVLCSVWPTCTI